MRENETFKINVKNGLYIGDLCYALADRVYDTVWGKQHNYEDGAYVDPETGLEFAVVGTAYGDGDYDYTTTSDAIHIDSFPVDAGIIGIADLGICDKQPHCSWGDLGVVLPEVRGEVEITYEDGKITVCFGSELITVYTGDDEDEDDWDDDDYDYDEDEEDE